MMNQLHKHPDLRLGEISFAWLWAAFEEMRALSRMAAPQVPTCCWLGTRDRMISLGVIRARVEGWANATLHMAEGAKHNIALERPAIRTAMFDGVAAHFDGQI